MVVNMNQTQLNNVNIMHVNISLNFIVFIIAVDVNCGKPNSNTMNVTYDLSKKRKPSGKLRTYVVSFLSLYT